MVCRLYGWNEEVDSNDDGDGNLDLDYDDDDDEEEEDEEDDQDCSYTLGQASSKLEVLCC